MRKIVALLFLFTKFVSLFVADNRHNVYCAMQL